MESKDRRVRRTRKALRDALIKLLLEKEIKDISVIELTDLADVNRGTFYLHYGDIYALYTSIEKDVLNEFYAIFARYQGEQSRALLPVVTEAFEFLARNADICRVILRSQDNEFLRRLVEVAQPKAEWEWRLLLGDADPGTYRYYYTFITSGCVGLLRTWLNNGTPESPSKMAAIAKIMIEQVAQSAEAASPIFSESGL